MAESRRAAAPAGMLEEVAAALARSPRELPPKYFYDARGAELFDRITRLPEYYLTRLERDLIAGFAAGWIRRVGARTLVELGPGSAAKTRPLLDAIVAGCASGDARPWYVPVDLSDAYLAELTAALDAEYGGRLEVHPVRADLTAELELPEATPRPLAIAFLGSTIGNFDAADAAALLRRVCRALRYSDRFLLGIDLRKDRAVLEAAYNDSAGVTAEFNRNILRVMNRELGADFDIDAFEHRAFYDEARGRIEMHLVARSPQTVTVPGAGTYRFERGESIRTEISCKYDRATVIELFASAGLALKHWVTDANRWYALASATRDVSR